MKKNKLKEWYKEGKNMSWNEIKDEAKDEWQEFDKNKTEIFIRDEKKVDKWMELESSVQKKAIATTRWLSVVSVLSIIDVIRILLEKGSYTLGLSVLNQLNVFFVSSIDNLKFIGIIPSVSIAIFLLILGFRIASKVSWQHLTYFIYFYIADGIIALVNKDILSIIIHAIILFMLFDGKSNFEKSS